MSDTWYVGVPSQERNADGIQENELVAEPAKEDVAR